MSWEGAPPQAPAAPDGIETRADLARELSSLRARSGLTIRALARRLDVPSATVGGYFSGRHLPGPAQLDVFCALLRACGVAEADLASWVAALARVRVTSDGRVGRMPAPYRGLEPFGTEDADRFFGREAATEEVLARLRRARGESAATGEAPAMLLVLGPSGSGKSSLLRAGVAARVRSGGLEADGRPWSTGVMTPGEDPVDAVSACLASTEGRPLLIVVDQLEEIFAVAAVERERFFAELRRRLCADTLVVAGLRADFFEAAAREPPLLDALRSAPVLLGPMTGEEVRSAIIEPARQAGVPVEDGLVELLLADLAPGSPNGFAYESGALPLLSYSLLATWQRAQRNRLTIADYRDAGGLRGAISQSAEELYARLTPGEQDLVRRILCRLVRVAADAPLTRRRVARQELEELAGAGAPGAEDADRRALAAVLDRLVEARLLTADSGTVVLTHEALLSAWPRLARWLERDRAGLLLHRQITDVANAWIAADRDPSLLLRGTRLHAVAEWAGEAGHRGELNRGERELLDASLALAESERRAARRRTRRMQQLLAVVGALAVAAVALAVVALEAQQSANRARDEALSRQVAIEAAGLEGSDPALAMQLALAAHRISATTQATSTLLDASASEMPTRLLGAIGPTSAALSRSGPELAVAHSATNEVSIYSLAGGRPSTLGHVSGGPPSSPLFTVALSPNGRLLAAGGTSRQVELWSLAAVDHPVRLATLRGFAGTVNAVTFSPDGRLLAAAAADGTVRQWSLGAPGDPRERAVLAAPGHPGLQAVSYSPDGLTLAAAGAGGSLDVWQAGPGGRLLTSRTVSASTLTSAVYSPNGRTLAVGGQDGLVRLWRVGAGGAIQPEHAPLGGFTSWVDSLAFSPDGRYLAAGDSDSSLRIWSTAGWGHVATLMHPAPVTGILFTTDGRRLVTVDEDGTTRIWSFPPPSALREPGNVYTIDYTANGDELAAVSGGPAGNVDLWNVADPWRPVHIAPVALPRSFGPVAGVEALSPDGKLLAVGNAQAKVRLVNLTQPHAPRLLGGAIPGGTPYIEQLNFSPNMRLMSTGDETGTLRLWSIADPAHPRAIATFGRRRGCGQVLGVVYSPGGRLLAAACADQKVWLWSIASPGHPKLLAMLGGFSSYVYTVAITPNGRTLIAGSADDSLRLWSIADPAHPRLLGRPLTGPTSTIYDIAVSPDGSTLAAGTTGQDVWLWNITDPSRPVEIADLRAAAGQVFDVTFSPNDSTLVASGGDETLHFWDYRPAQVAARVCALAGDPITRAEWAQYIQGAAYDPPCGVPRRLR